MRDGEKDGRDKYLEEKRVFCSIFNWENSIFKLV